MTFTPPMLCNSITQEEINSKKVRGYLADLKVDGMRTIVHHSPSGEVTVYSRTGKIYTEHVPHIVESVQKYTEPGTTLDGELAIVTSLDPIQENLAPKVSFNRTMRVMGSKPERARELQVTQFGGISLILFDILERDQQDFKELPFSARRRELEDLYFPDEGSYMKKSPVWRREDYTELFQLVESRGHEGLILKNPDGLYVPDGRRVGNQYKVKTVSTADVVVMGFTKANYGKTGKWDGLIGAIEFGAYTPSGELKRLGQCSGMTDDARRWWTDLASRVGDDPEWLNQYVIEIQYNDLVGSGEVRTPRFPQFLRIRDDKRPRDCTVNQFAK